MPAPQPTPVVGAPNETLTPCGNRLSGRHNTSSQMVDVSVLNNCATSDLLVGVTGSAGSCSRTFSETMLVFALPAWSPMQDYLQSAVMTVVLADKVNPGP